MVCSGVGARVRARSEKGSVVRVKSRIREAGRALALLVCGSAPSLGAEGVVDVAAADVAAQWSDEVWSSANRGEDAALELLTNLPGDVDDGTVGGLVSAIDRYRAHIERREAERAARMGELRDEMEGALGEGDLLEALTSALELHMIVTTKGEVVGEDRVRGLIEVASREAAEAEGEGRWLEAFALYSRLHMLTEESAWVSFKRDESRVRDRIEMLRLYVPERLHEMQDARRQAMGEDVLPPYNGLGDDWRERLESIDPGMVKHAMGFAANRHVERRDAAAMVESGLERVRTLVTTRDLSPALPSLEDGDRVGELLDEIDGISERVRGRAMGPYEIRLAIDELLRSNNRTLGIPEAAILHEFGTGCASSLDEFTSFYWPDDLESFNRTASGNFTGVGIQISLNDEMELMVVTPVHGTPAFRAGIKAKDLIRTVDGHSTTGMGTFQAVQKIVGPAGSPVTLGIEREGEDELLEFELARAVIPLYSVKGWRRNGPEEDDWDWFVDEERGIGYVRLTQFIKGSGNDLRRAVREMVRGGVKGFILDLRFNGGGLLDEAVEVTNLFLDSGTIVTQENAVGRVMGREEARRGNALVTDLPLVVLVNESSASASEIVAGALQDHDRAVIVGQRSFGKGSVQNVFELADGRAAFKLTTQYYKLPGGRLIHRKDGSPEWGVDPDVEVESLPQQISDALELRLGADIVEYDADGNVLEGGDRPDPDALLSEGIDPQLETALLLLQARVIGEDLARRASLD